MSHYVLCVTAIKTHYVSDVRRIISPQNDVRAVSKRHRDVHEALLPCIAKIINCRRGRGPPLCFAIGKTARLARF